MKILRDRNDALYVGKRTQKKSSKNKWNGR